MKRLFLLMSFFIFVQAEAQNHVQWPDSIYSGKQSTFHVQGVAVDEAHGYVYFSFTNSLLKTDLQGHQIGSITGFIGHLGDIDINPENGKVYASLEYKNDAIGQGINKKLNLTEKRSEENFYVAIIDGNKITQTEMDAASAGIVKTVFLKDVADDYNDTVRTGASIFPHRYGCSGIDGIALAPKIGDLDKKKFLLYVAYGIYSDTSRKDNDNQILLTYDTKDLDRYARPLSQQNLHDSGPKKSLNKFFVKTGNTSYGIQNLAYDPATGNIFAAVYKGNKKQFPNYDLFVIDGSKAPIKDVLLLAEGGLYDAPSNTNGWRFKWGSTGLCPLGNGLFYISHNGKDQNGIQDCTLYLYRWTGKEETPFERL